MKAKANFNFDYEVFPGREELPGRFAALMDDAERAAALAYAPYSGYKVGAAILLDDQTVVAGNNQENAAYPSGLCAERVALFAAHAGAPGKAMLAIAIFVAADQHLEGMPVTPCGACRQSIIEYETLQDMPIRIFTASAGSPVYSFGSAADLLPFAFTRKHLQA